MATETNTRNFGSPLGISLFEILSGVMTSSGPQSVEDLLGFNSSRFSTPPPAPIISICVAPFGAFFEALFESRASVLIKRKGGKGRYPSVSSVLEIIDAAKVPCESILRTFTAEGIERYSFFQTEEQRSYCKGFIEWMLKIFTHVRFSYVNELGKAPGNSEAVDTTALLEDFVEKALSEKENLLKCSPELAGHFVAGVLLEIFDILVNKKLEIDHFSIEEIFVILKKAHVRIPSSLKEAEDRLGVLQRLLAANLMASRKKSQEDASPKEAVPQAEAPAPAAPQPQAKSVPETTPSCETPGGPTVNIRVFSGGCHHKSSQ